MANLPILMSAPMVRAILREIEQPGTGKTQTRRGGMKRMSNPGREYTSEVAAAMRLLGLHGERILLHQRLQVLEQFVTVLGNVEKRGHHFVASYGHCRRSWVGGDIKKAIQPSNVEPNGSEQGDAFDGERIQCIPGFDKAIRLTKPESLVIDWSAADFKKSDSFDSVHRGRGFFVELRSGHVRFQEQVFPRRFSPNDLQASIIADFGNRTGVGNQCRSHHSESRCGSPNLRDDFSPAFHQKGWRDQEYSCRDKGRSHPKFPSPTHSRFPTTMDPTFVMARRADGDKCYVGELL